MGTTVTVEFDLWNMTAGELIGLLAALNSVSAGARVTGDDVASMMGARDMVHTQLSSLIGEAEAHMANKLAPDLERLVLLAPGEAVQTKMVVELRAQVERLQGDLENVNAKLVRMKDNRDYYFGLSRTESEDANHWQVRATQLRSRVSELERRIQSLRELLNGEVQ